MFRKNIFLMSLLVITVFGSCKKYEDKKGDATDPRLTRPYCNAPDAVNYNWNFPGTPDNTTCIYPTDVFKGNYTYTDSIYNGNGLFIRAQTLLISFSPSSKTKMTLSGFCPTGTLSFTASRKLRADADSNVANGQLLCRSQDTLSGYMNRNDVIDAPIQFSLSVLSDSGVFFHRGSAIKR